jgi:HD-GYP domain-containing protein (c-di-GMP phosphodiesterase class II)
LITRIQTYKGLLFVLTSDRLYRAELPADEALEIKKSQAGRHFDPDVIDVFL